MREDPRLCIATGPLLPVPAVHGGAVHRMWSHLAPCFARAGWRTMIEARTWPGQAPAEVIDGVEHRRFAGFAQSRHTSWNLIRDLPYAWRLARRLRSADVLVVNDFWLPMFARSVQGRLVISVNRRPKRGQAWIWRKAAALVAPTQAIAADLCELAPQLRSRTHVIANALPLAHFSQAQAQRDPTGLLYVGRLHPEKGVEVAIRAVAGLRRRGAAVSLSIVGPADTDAGGAGADYLAHLKQLAAGDPAIRFLGAQYDPQKLAQLYAGHQLMLYPSLAERGETFGVAPLEAMAAGCIPVVSALPCFADFIHDGRNAAVFDHRAANPSYELESRLEKLLAAPQLHADLRAEALQTAAAHDTNLIAIRWLALFAELHEPTRKRVSE